MVVGFDPVHARSVQRSFTVHGDEEAAEQRRRELVDDFGISRVAFASEASRFSVGELLEQFFAAPHLWKPATVSSHSHVIRSLVVDSLARRRLIALTGGDVQAAICRWQAAGLSVSTVSARWLILRSALSWAVSEGVLRSNPLAGMHGPSRPQPRRHHTLSEVRILLRWAEGTVEKARFAQRLTRNRPGCDDNSSPPSRDSFLCVWPPTPGPDGANWPCSGSEISMAESSPSSAVCLVAYLDPPSPAGTAD